MAAAHALGESLGLEPHKSCSPTRTRSGPAVLLRQCGTVGRLLRILDGWLLTAGECRHDLPVTMLRNVTLARAAALQLLAHGYRLPVLSW